MWVSKDLSILVGKSIKCLYYVTAIYIDDFTHTEHWTKMLERRWDASFLYKIESINCRMLVSKYKIKGNLLKKINDIKHIVLCILTHIKIVND